MIGRLVTIPAHKNLSTMPGCPADSAQNSTTASVDQIIAPVRPIHFRRLVHRLPDDPFRMVQIIKSINLRNINRIRIGKFL